MSPEEVKAIMNKHEADFHGQVGYEDFQLCMNEVEAIVSKALERASADGWTCYDTEEHAWTNSRMQSGPLFKTTSELIEQYKEG